MRFLWLLIFPFLCLSAQPIEERMIFVPLEDWASIVKSEPKGMRMSYGEYLELTKNLGKETPKSPIDIVIHDVQYLGKIDNKTLHTEIMIIFTSLQDKPIELVLDLGNMSIEKAELDEKPAWINAESLVTILNPQTNIYPQPNQLADFNNQQQIQQQGQQQVVQQQIQQQVQQQNNWNVQQNNLANNWNTQQNNLANAPVTPQIIPSEDLVRYRLNCQGRGQHKARLIAHTRLKPQKDELHATLKLTNFPKQILKLDVPSEWECITTPAIHNTNGTEHTIYLGDSSSLELKLKPKEQKDVKEAIVLTTINASHLVRLDSLISNFQIVLDVRHNTQKSFTLAIPDNLEIVSISESRWEAKTHDPNKAPNDQTNPPRGTKLLLVELEKGVTGIYNISLKCEQQLPVEDTNIILPQLNILGNVFRQEGWIQIQKTDDITLEIGEIQEVRQVASQQTISGLHNFGEEQVCLFKVGAGSPSISFRKKEVIPQVKATTISAMTIYRQGMSLTVEVKWEVLKGKIKELPLQLPTGWKFASLEVNILESSRYLRPIIFHHSIKNDILMIVLDQKLERGRIARALIKFHNLPEDWKTDWSIYPLDIPLVKPLQSEFSPSFAGVITDFDYEIQDIQLTQASSVDFEIVKPLGIESQDLRLGIKLHNTDAKVSLKIKNKIPYTSVNILNYLLVEPDRIRGCIALRYEVKNASRDTFEFILPENFPYVLNIQGDTKEELSGNNTNRSLPYLGQDLIKEKILIPNAKGQQHWKIILHQKVLETYTLYLNYEVQIQQQIMSFDIPTITCLDVNRRHGFVGVAGISQANLEIIGDNKLSSVPTTEFPIVGASKFNLPLYFLKTYKFADPNFKLSVNITMYDKMPVVLAVLESIIIRTIYTQEDEERVYCEYQLNHLGQQDFDIRLPPDSDFWSVVVNDVGEKPLQKENGILSIPIPHHNNGQSDIIKIAYSRKVKPLQTSGNIVLQAPQTPVEIPIQKVDWQLQLPPEYQITTQHDEQRMRPWYIPILIASDKILKVEERILSEIDYDMPSYKVYSPAVPKEQYDYDVSNNYRDRMNDDQPLAVNPNKSMPQQMPQPIMRRPAMPEGRVKEKAKSEVASGKKMSQPIAKSPPMKANKWQAPESKVQNIPMPSPPPPPMAQMPPEPSVYPEEDIKMPEQAELEVPPSPMESTIEPADELGSIASDKLDEEEYYDQSAVTGEDSDKSLAFGNENRETTKDFERNITTTPTSSSSLGKAGQKHGTTIESQTKSRAGLAQTKVAGVTSLNVSLQYDPNIIDHTYLDIGKTQDGKIEATARYFHIDTFRSLNLVFTGIAGILGLLLWFSHRPPRLAICLAALVLTVFIPIWFGNWLLPYCNSFAYGILLSWLVWGFYLVCCKLSRGTPSPTSKIIVLFACLLALNYTTAQPNQPPTQPTIIPTVYVPYDPEETADLDESSIVFVPYQQYVNLWNKKYPAHAIGIPDDTKQAPYYLYQARYQGKIEKEKVLCHAQFCVEVRQAPAMIPLGLAGNAVQSASLYKENVLISQSPAIQPDANGSYTILLNQEGQYRIELDLLTPGKITTRRGELALQLQPIATSIFEITLDSDLEISLGDWNGHWYEFIEQNQKKVQIFPGLNSNIRILWYPSTEQSKAKGLNIAVNSTHTLTISDKLLSLDSALNYQIISSKKLEKLLLQVPYDFTILQLQCTFLKQWRLTKEKGIAQVTLELMEHEQNNIQVQFKAEKIIQKLPLDEKFPEVIPLDAARETGKTILATHNSYSVLIQKSSNIRKIDSIQQSEYFKEIFQYSIHPFVLDFSIQEQSMDNKAESALRMQVGEEKIQFDCQTIVEVRGREMFGMEVKIPLGYNILKVQGARVKNWHVQQNQDYQLLTLIWTSNIERGETLEWSAQLEREISEDAKTFSLPYLKSPQIQSHTGTLILLSSSNLGLKLIETSKLIPLDINNFSPAPNLFVNRYAFQFNDNEYSGTIQCETKAPKVEADIVMELLVEDDWLHLGYYIKYKIGVAPIDTFQFRIPESLAEHLQICGENIKEIKRELKKDKRESSYIYTITSHNKIPDEFNLQIFPRVLPNQNEIITFYPISVLPSDMKQRAWILIQNSSQAELTTIPDQYEGLSEIQAHQVGFLPSNAEAQQYIAYKIENLRKWQLGLLQTKPRVVIHTHASVDHIKVNTVISEYGECRQKIVYNVRHLGLQFLELQFSATNKQLDNIKIWGVFVDDQFIRPVKKDNTLLIPLQYGATGLTNEERVAVRLIYSHKVELLNSGKVNILQLPDIPNIKETGQISWTVLLPKGYMYRFGGDISRDIQETYFEEYRRVSNVQANVPAGKEMSDEQKKNKQTKILEQLSSENRLQIRTESAQQERQKAQEQLLNQDIQQQSNIEQNEDNLRRYQQYGLRNMRDVQRAVGPGVNQKIYQDTTERKFIGESSGEFAKRQAESFVFNDDLQQQKEKQAISYFQFDLQTPYESQSFSFTNRKGTAKLEIYSTRDPWLSLFWRSLQFILFIGLFILGYYVRLFRRDEPFTVMKCFLWICFFMLAIFIAFSLNIVSYLYL